MYIIIITLLNKMCVVFQAGLNFTVSVKQSPLVDFHFLDGYCRIVDPTGLLAHFYRPSRHRCHTELFRGQTIRCPEIVTFICLTREKEREIDFTAMRHVNHFEGFFFGLARKRTKISTTTESRGGKHPAALAI